MSTGAALRDQIASHYSYMRKQARYMCQPPIQPDDVVHETIIRMLETSHVVRGSFKPYAKVALRSTLISLLRKAYVRHDAGDNRNIPVEPWHAVIPGPQDDHMETTEVFDRIAALPLPSFRLFAQMEFMGDTSEDIRRRDHVPLGTTKSLKFRTDAVVFQDHLVDPGARGIAARSCAANAPYNAAALWRMMEARQCAV